MQQPELLQYTIEVLERLGITYMVVGSIASAVYGEPRSTLDIDVVVAPTATELEQLCKAFPGPDFYVSKEAGAMRCGHAANSTCFIQLRAIRSIL